MVFEDKYLTCKDCGNEFVFGSGEQEFFAEKGFTNIPGRCPECRSAKKRAGGSSRGNSYGGRPEREMHTAVCSACGGEAQVPFKPRGDKPIYCRTCFQNQASSY